MAGFIFGGNTGLKASDLQSRRDAMSDREVIAKTLAERMKRKPRNLGEGIGYLADSVASAYTMNKLKSERDAYNKDVAKGRSDAWGRIMAAMAGGGAAGATGAPETPPPPAGGGAVSGDGGAFYKLLDAKEGGGDYGTLFNYANRPGGKFADVDITGMTLDELNAFTDPSGPYGQYVAGLNKGTVATPLGRGQIVGTTLRDAAAEMGLPGDTKFTPEIQDKIIAHLARRRLKPGMSQAEKRAALAAEWAGFRNASPAELDMAIAEIEGGGMGGAVADPMAAGAGAGGVTPPPAGGMSPRVAALIEAAGSEYLTPEQRQVVNAMLAQEMAKGQPMDPYKAAQLDAEKRRYELDRERLAETKRMNDARISGKVTDGTSVTVNNAGETAFEKESAKEQAKLFSAWMDAGVNAKADIANINELDRLINVEGVGGTADAWQVWAQNRLGINTGVSGPVEAYAAMIERLVPAQRPPGSGVMSDADVRMFRQSLPQLINSPEGNNLILRTMRGMTEYKIKLGEISAAVMTGKMSREEGLKALYAIPDPMSEFKETVGANTAGAATSGTDAAPAGTDAAAGDVPQNFLDEGYDASTWKYLDPEQRKLWE